MSMPIDEHDAGQHVDGWKRALADAMAEVPAACMNTAPISDAPLIRPRLRATLSMPAITPRCAAVTPCITPVLLAV